MLRRIQRFIEPAGQGDGGDFVQVGLKGGAYGAGVGNFVAHVITVVDSGEYKVGLFLQNLLDSRLHAVRRSAIYLVGSFHRCGKVLYLFQGKRSVDGELLGHGAALPGRSNHPHISESSCRSGQQGQTRSVNGIVVDDQKIHRSSFYFFQVFSWRTMENPVFHCGAASSKAEADQHRAPVGKLI